MTPSCRGAAWRLARFAPHAVLAAALAVPASAQAPAAAAAPAALPGIETFFRNADVSAMKLSPSGKWLAMTAAAGNGRIALAVADVDGKAPVALAAAANNTDV